MSDAGCDQALLLQAEFDGELDAAQSAALAVHRAGCDICRANWDTLEAARAALNESDLYHRATPALRQALGARLDASETVAPRRAARTWWRPALGLGAGIGAAAAALVMLLVIPPADDALLGALVDAHVRALQPGHLADVVSTDQHTVKPWFDGKLDFAPPVKDLAAQGFPLIGGRLDYLGGRAVAALDYQHGKHPIDLMIWPDRGADATPNSARHNGYNLIHWTQDGMSLWAVSDVERDQLEAFVHDWQRAP
ncbi:MAG TPA: hypothetical protein VN802_19465 [Stellaceae bacterium]|nr:hypothetical protein [Stellaceae bacterium]